MTAVIDVSTSMYRDDLLQGLIEDHSKALIAYARTIAKDH